MTRPARHIVADNVAGRTGSQGESRCGAGRVDPDVLALAEQKPMVHARRNVETDDIALWVDPEGSGACCTRVVKGGEDAFLEQKTVIDAGGVRVPARDISSGVDSERERRAGTGNLDSGEDATGKQESSSDASGRVEPDNIPLRIDAPCKSVCRAGDIDGEEVAVANLARTFRLPPASKRARCARRAPAPTDRSRRRESAGSER